MAQTDNEYIELRRQNARLLKQLLNTLDQYNSLRLYAESIDTRVHNLEAMIAQAQEHGLRGRKRSTTEPGPDTENLKT